jgi:hypothetical protein
MFAHRSRGDAAGLQAMAAEAFAVIDALIDEGIAAGALAPGTLIASPSS